MVDKIEERRKAKTKNVKNIAIMEEGAVFKILYVNLHEKDLYKGLDVEDNIKEVSKK